MAILSLSDDLRAFAVNSSPSGSSLHGTTSARQDHPKSRHLTVLMWLKVQRTSQWLASLSSLQSMTQERKIFSTGWRTSGYPTNISSKL